MLNTRSRDYLDLCLHFFIVVVVASWTDQRWAKNDKISIHTQTEPFINALFISTVPDLLYAVVTCSVSIGSRSTIVLQCVTRLKCILVLHLTKMSVDRPIIKVVL